MMSASRNRTLTELPADAQSVYQGRHHLGWTIQRGKAFEAVGSDRISLGVYDTVLQARNAVWCGEG
jgi:hypothetical protein